MVDKPRRKELQARAVSRRAPAGVYRIVNRRTGKALLASSTNLDVSEAATPRPGHGHRTAGTRNRFEFAKATASPIGVDLRLRSDIEGRRVRCLRARGPRRARGARRCEGRRRQRRRCRLEALWRECYDPAELC